MSDQPIKVAKLIDFPTTARDDAWVDGLRKFLDDAREEGVLGSFVGFGVLENGDDAFHVGNLDTTDRAHAYLIVGALEEMKMRILREIGRS